MANESDTDDQPDDVTDTDELGDISDEDAERLLADAIDSDSDDDTDERPAKKSDTDLDGLRGEIAKWRGLARKHEKQFKTASARLKEFEDQGKSEAERLQETVQDTRTRAEKAEAALRRREIAEDRAPAHATLAQIKAVAKRLSGDSDEDLEADADELFALLVPEPSKTRTAERPREALKRPRGGSDPDDEPEENDPRKLADLIRAKRI